MAIFWFCQRCIEDFEGDVFEHWNKETGQILCEKCAKKEGKGNDIPSNG